MKVEPEVVHLLKENDVLYQSLLKIATGTIYIHAGKGVAAYLLGKLHQDEAWQMQNIKKALDYYDMASQHQHVEASNLLGNLYYEGDEKLGIAKDQSKAFLYFKKMCDYHTGNAYSYYRLGYLFENGHGTPLSTDRAIEQYERAVRLGSSLAHYRLGIIFYRKLKEANKNTSHYSMQYERPAFQRKAVQYFETAISTPGFTEKNNAYNYLGIISQEEEKWTQAEKYYLIAAKENLPLAQFNLGMLYQTKFNPPKMHEAVHWYKKAATANLSLAQYELACLYETGHSVLPVDSLQAFILFNQLADKEYEPAKNKFSDPNSILFHYKELYESTGNDLIRLEQLVKLEEALGYRFVNVTYLIDALNRNIFPNRNEAIYQRYEFLEDRILNVSIAAYLTKHAPDEWSVEQLNNGYKELVSNFSATEVARQLFLGDLIILADNEKDHPITDKMLADACEAIIGAIMKDSEMTQAEKVVVALWEQYLKLVLTKPLNPSQAPQSTIKLTSQSSPNKNKELSRSLSSGSLQFFKQYPQMKPATLKSYLEQYPHRATNRNEGKVGDTALTMALKQLKNVTAPKKINQKIEKIEILLNAGVSWTQANSKGKTPEMILQELHLSSEVQQKILSLKR